MDKWRSIMKVFITEIIVLISVIIFSMIWKER